MVKKITLALLSLLLVPLGMMAQSVTVSPATGNLIAALSKDQSSSSQSQVEVGFVRGWSAMWRHEQLPLSFVVSDVPELLNGEIKIPAGNLNKRDKTNEDGTKTPQLLVIGGESSDCYMVLSLPKGYRFKRYKIVLLNNLNGDNYKGFDFPDNTVTKEFVEQKDNFDGAILASTGEMATTNETDPYVIERKSNSDDDMGNQLYFRIKHTTKGFYGLTIQSFEIDFTAEGTFGANVTPTSKRDVKKSLVMAPFKTNKIDIGAVEMREKTITEGGQSITGKFFAYTYENVKDLDAYTYIYQQEAIEDDIPMDVAQTKKIFPVEVGGKNYFAFGNGTYYVEPPTLVYSQTGLSYPIGYRVVGAKFTPQWSDEVEGETVDVTPYYITYTTTSWGETTTYYLNDQLRFTATEFPWYHDPNTGSIYTGSDDNKRYLSCEGSESDYRTLSLSTTSDNHYNLIVFNKNGTDYIGWDGTGNDWWYLNVYSISRPYLFRNTYYSVSRNNPAKWSGGEADVLTYPTFKPGTYTLKVYDKTGTTKIAEKTVEKAEDAGSVIDLTAKTYGFNNDAVMFTISGLTEDDPETADVDESTQALVDVSLFMQALNPYVDKMTVNCNLTDLPSTPQEFTANDFKVSGGEFVFYTPSGYTGDVNFTLTDLWSSYGDNTYYADDTDLRKDGYARYSFVRSPYFSAFDGFAGNKVTPTETVSWNDDDTDLGLYDTRYVGTGTSVQPGAEIAYTHKVYADEVGDKAFRFNNADELVNTTTGVTRRYFEEYPFSVSAYTNKTGTNGSFVKASLNSSNPNGTYYVFVGDETRYNIAPHTGWQHRYYAYYQMDINLSSETFNPKYTWTKVYGNTCVWDAEKKKDVDKSMWGLKLNTVDSNDETKVVPGYLSVADINTYLSNNLDENNVTAPASTDQILYVDGSELYSIAGSGTNTLQSIKNRLAPNALFYLPENTTSTEDNFAYKTSAGSFLAGKDIVIQDKQPFYAPYPILIDKDKGVARYTREVTWEKYGATTKQSLILPFTIAINNDGVYKGSNSSFKVTTLTNAEFTHNDEKDCETATFAPLTKKTSTEANTPYMVDITSPDNGTFVVEQAGAEVAATIIPSTNVTGDYMFYGEPVKVKYNGSTSEATFTPRGSFSGKIYDAKEDDFRGANVFFYYGSSNMFRSSAALSTAYNNLWAYPFRAFYGYKAGVGAKNLAAFMFSYGDEEINGISENTKRIDFAVQSGKGYLQITAGKDANVRINSLNGMQVASEQMAAGDTRTINLASGVYIINGMKVIVK